MTPASHTPVVLILSLGADHIRTSKAERALARRGVNDAKSILMHILARGHGPVRVPRCENTERLINELRSAGINARVR
jgi:hypothetical protein